MLGVLTNYKEWIFTKYNFQKEVENVVFENNQTKLSDAQRSTHHAFEISEKFTIMNDRFEIDVD